MNHLNDKCLHFASIIYELIRQIRLNLLLITPTEHTSIIPRTYSNTLKTYISHCLTGWSSLDSKFQFSFWYLFYIFIWYNFFLNILQLVLESKHKLIKKYFFHFFQVSIWIWLKKTNIRNDAKVTFLFLYSVYFVLFPEGALVFYPISLVFHLYNLLKKKLQYPSDRYFVMITVNNNGCLMERVYAA